jgi:hypothetical protein
MIPRDVTVRCESCGRALACRRIYMDHPGVPLIGEAVGSAFTKALREGAVFNADDGTLTCPDCEEVQS